MLLSVDQFCVPFIIEHFTKANIMPYGHTCSELRSSCLKICDLLIFCKLYFTLKGNVIVIVVETILVIAVNCLKMEWFSPRMKKHSIIQA